MIIDGKSIAAQIRAQLKQDVTQLRQQHGIEVGLGALLDGNYAPSKIYVGMKEKACRQVGIHSKVVEIESNRDMVLQTIAAFNQDPAIHGILVQLPLPQPLNSDAVIAAVTPEKDADGLHPLNLGRLFAGTPQVVPCTPAGIMAMLDEVGCDPTGKEAVVVGRSNIVGKPVAQLLLMRHATVTLCHSRTAKLKEHVQRADILVAALGKAHFIRGDWVKPGAVVIDVGINRLADGSLVGDVEFAAAERRASHITPVPGGVGPMTVAMLLKNTVTLAKRQNGLL